MKATPLLDHYTVEKLDPILRAIPLFAWIMEIAPQQLESLLHHCRLFRLKPGETIIKKGERTQWIYFVLLGGGFAYVDEEDQTPINHLQKNDMFGELAAILHVPRTASVIANYDHPESFFLGIDFALFEDNDKAKIDDSVTVLMYQAIQRTIFQRLRSLYQAISQHHSLGAIPRPERPPHYLETKKQIELYKKNCADGAQLLTSFSNELSALLNHKTVMY